MQGDSEIIPIGRIEKSILLVRGQRVILDKDLAELYGVTTARLNQQVQRNLDRFPTDFMFQLRPEESRSLMLQFATSKAGRGGTRKAANVFTEHGAIMAASVLKTEQAVKVSVYVVRAFVKLREILSAHKELAAKLSELEGKLDRHDDQISCLIEAIRQLMAPPPEPKRKPIGYASEI